MEEEVKNNAKMQSMATDQEKDKHDYYRNKNILAPMVRVGTLPMRLLALRYGADIVYCEEIIDFKILNAKKVENEILGTTDFILSDDTLVFSTCPEEREKLVFQLGTSDATRALRAAEKVQDYVAAVDVNMGCPKEFSIKGGMGAALLKQPKKIKEILTTLVKGLSIPVTCKIRVLPELEDTLELVKLIESTGVAAVAVHGRTKEERSGHKNRNDVIKAISDNITIPVIANGGSKEIKKFDDISLFKEQTGCSSVMLARAAEWNPSIFRQQGTLPLLDVVREYIKMAIDYDNNYTNTKYCVLQMMRFDMHIKEGQDTLGITSLQEISDVWGLSDYFQEKQGILSSKKAENERQNKIVSDIIVTEQEDGRLLINMPLQYLKKDFPSVISPKQRSFEWCKRRKITRPFYNTTERKEDRKFNSVLHIGKCEFTTPYWTKSKQLAEQASAAVATTVLRIEDGRAENVSEQLEYCKVRWRELLAENPNWSVFDCPSNDEKNGQLGDQVGSKRKYKCSESSDLKNSTEKQDTENSNKRKHVETENDR